MRKGGTPRKLINICWEKQKLKILKVQSHSDLPVMIQPAGPAVMNKISALFFMMMAELKLESIDFERYSQLEFWTSL